MSKTILTNSVGVVLNLQNNSEKEAILRVITASGTFEIKDAGDEVTLFLKKASPQKFYFRKNKKSVWKINTKKMFSNIRIRKVKGQVGSLDQIAKSQNIVLASSDSVGAVCSGVIV